MNRQEEIRKAIQLKKDNIKIIESNLQVLDARIEEDSSRAITFEDSINKLKREIRELSKDEFEAGFEEWKKDAKPVKPVTYYLSEADVLKVNYIQSLHDTGESRGASGGSTGILFTATGIGANISVEIDGESYDITDYGSW